MQLKTLLEHLAKRGMPEQLLYERLRDIGAGTFNENYLEKRATDPIIVAFSL